MAFIGFSSLHFIRMLLSGRVGLGLFEIAEKVHHQRSNTMKHGQWNVSGLLIQLQLEWSFTVQLIPGWLLNRTPMASAPDYLLTSHLEPRRPYTAEMVGYPKRSRYYEVFIATWTLSASGLLVYCLEYLLWERWKCVFKNERLVDTAQLVLFVVPFLICVLDFPTADYTTFVLLFNVCCCLLYSTCCLHKRFRSTAQSGPPTCTTAMQPDMPSQLPGKVGRPHNDCLTAYRSIVYISTAVCIFARDQPCWNNDFSKADTFGTGVMDIGLGCFVVCIGSLGPTASRPRAKVDRPAAMKKAGVQFLLLSVCGLVKSIAVVVTIARNNIQFESSWREYGVHWNAFYSLAVAKLAGTALELYLLPVRVPPLFAALVVGVGHEVLLAWAGLALYVLAPGNPEPYNRSNLLGANREGICSSPGLIVLYLVGCQLGRWTNAWSRRRRLLSGGVGDNDGLGRLVTYLTVLMLGCFVYRVLPTHMPQLVLPESRRLLNLSHCVWIAAFSAFCLLNACLLFAARSALFHGLSESGDSGRVPLHIRRVDSAGLLYFLASNLLTGLANLLIRLTFADREDTDGAPCFLFVLLYMVVVYQVAWLAQRLVSVRALANWLAARCLCC